MAYEDDEYEGDEDVGGGAEEASPPPAAASKPEDDWEPYQQDDRGKWVPASTSQKDDDWEPYRQNAKGDWEPLKKTPEDEGIVGTFARELAHDIGPAAAGAVTGGAAAGAAGAAAGTLGAGPIGGTVAGIAGGLAGGFAGGYGAEKVQEAALKYLNADDSAQRQANREANPWTAAAASGLSNLVGFTHGAVSGATRVASAALGGGVAAGSAAAQEGSDFFTPEGFKKALPDIVAQAAAGGAFASPRGYVQDAQNWGERWMAARAGRAGAAAAAAASAPEAPAQGRMDFGQDGAPGAGATRTPQQMEMDLRPPGRAPDTQGELPLNLPPEQGQLDLPNPQARGAGGRVPQPQGEAAPATPETRVEVPGSGDAPHGTPGPQAAGGVAETPAPPPKPAEATPGHGPEDYGKRPPTQEPPAGVNIGEDPTLKAVFDNPAAKAKVEPETPQLPPTPPTKYGAKLDAEFPKMGPKSGREQPLMPAEKPIAAASEARRSPNGFTYEKTPEGKWAVKDPDGGLVSEHPNMGKAIMAMNRADKAAMAPEKPAVPPLPPEQPAAPKPAAVTPVKQFGSDLPTAVKPKRGDPGLASYNYVTKQAKDLTAKRGIPARVVRTPEGGYAVTTAREPAAKSAEAPKPKTTEITVMRDPITGREQKFKVADESTFREVLEKHGTREGLHEGLTKFLGEKVMKEIGNMPVYIVPESEINRAGMRGSLGGYNRQQDHIFLNDAAFKNPENLKHAIIHEGLHAVTAHAVLKDPDLRKAINGIMKDVAQADPFHPQRKDTKYGFTNEREFISEAFSNPTFQKMLGEHQLSPGAASRLSEYLGTPVKNAWDAVVGAVRKFFNIPKDQISALEGMIRATAKAMDINPKAKGDFLKRNAVEDKQGEYREPFEKLERVRSADETPAATATADDLKNDLWTNVKRWVGAVASETESGRAARNNIMGEFGEKNQLKTVADAKFTNEMHRMMNDLAKTQEGQDRQRALVNYIQGGSDFPNFRPTEGEKRVVDVLRDIHKMFENKLRSMPEFEQMKFWDNDKYLAGQYENPKEAIKFYRDNIAAGGGGSTKKKFFPTDEDARRAGFTPISTNPIERVLRYTNAMGDYIAYRQIVANGEKSGHIKYFTPETVAAAGTPNPYRRGGPPEGWAPMRGLTNKDGKQAYAPRDYAETFNNAFGPGLGHAIGAEDLVSSLRRASNTFTMLELGIPTYHAFTTVHERMASGLSTALSQAASGNVADAGKTLAKALASPVQEARLKGGEGQRLADVYAGKVEGTPGEQKIVKAMKLANFSPIGMKHALDYDMSKAGSLWNSIAKGSLKHEMIAEYKSIVGDKNWKEGMSFVPRMAGRMMQSIAKPLFEHYIPRMKTAAFSENMQAWMKANPNHTDAQFQEAAIKIGKSIDNRMGEMAHDNMMMNRVLRDAASLTLRSFSFTVGGVFREIGGGTQSLARGALKGENRLSLSAKNYDPRAAYAVAFPMSVAAMSMLYQFLKTGKGPDEWRDLAWPETGGKQPGVGKGRQVPERALLPGYHKDIAAYIAHPGREAGNKVAGLWSAIGEQLANSKMTETGPKPIVPPKASVPEALGERAKAFGERMTPIFVRSAGKTPYKQSNISYPEQLLGLRAPGKWVSDPQGQKIADDRRAEREWRASERRQNVDRGYRGVAPEPRRVLRRDQ